METFRSLGLPQAVKKHLTLHQREGKYQEADYVESFVSVFAAGGDCVDDFEILRQDEGLKKLGLRVRPPFLNSPRYPHSITTEIFVIPPRNWSLVRQFEYLITDYGRLPHYLKEAFRPSISDNDYHLKCRMR